MVEKGDTALKVLQNKGEWAALQNIGVTEEAIQKNAGVKRNDTALDRNIVSKVFSMQKPNSGEKVFDKVILADGDYALISLSKVVVDTAEIDETLQQGYAQSLAVRERAAVMAALREKADVELFPNNIQ